MAAFENDKQLRIHFKRHAHEFPFATYDEYVARASALCDSADCPEGVDQCFRDCPWDSDEKRIRFKESTGEFVIALRDKPHILVTYYIPDPARHPFATSREYFEAECECLHPPKHWK